MPPFICQTYSLVHRRSLPFQIAPRPPVTANVFSAIVRLPKLPVQLLQMHVGFERRVS